MPDSLSTTVIIAVPGGQETQELSLEAAQEAFARGEIEPTRWAWCRTNQNWIPIADLPEFQFTPTPVPTTEPEEPVTHVQEEPHVEQEEPHVEQEQPVVAAGASAAQVRPIVQTVTRVKSRKELVVKEESTFSFFKLFVVLLGLAVAGVVVANYELVDLPLKANLANTHFADTPVYAHLGAFCQPDTIIIHLRPSSTVTAANLANFLISLAYSTPQQPINHQAFSTVGFTSSWTSQVLMSGDDWQTLAGMAKATDEAKEDFILTRIGYPSGQRLMSASNFLGPDAQAERRDKTWAILASILLKN